LAFGSLRSNTNPDHRSYQQVIYLAGITGNNRPPPAIAVRDVRGMK
jgi:hypothetical protein